MAKMGVPTEGVSLLAAYPQMLELIEQHRTADLPDDVLLQLTRVHVLSQILDGTPTDFHFKAYPLPRPDYETRQRLPICEERSVTVSGKNWEISIDIDLFGLIEWFHVEGTPELYRALEPYLPMGE